MKWEMFGFWLAKSIVKFHKKRRRKETSLNLRNVRK